MSPKEALSGVLGKSIPSGNGEVRYNCPFCITRGYGTDTKQHLYVNMDKGLFLCFRCSEGGRLTKLYHYLKIPVGHVLPEPTSRGSLDAVISQLSVSLVTDLPDQTILEFPCPVVPAWSVPEVRAYLQSRGVSESDSKAYSLQSGNFFGCERIFFPVYRPWTKDLIYWTGRKFLAGDEEKKDVLRYTTPKGAKKNLLYGMDVVVQQPGYPDHVIITEGPMSAIAAGRKAVATLGKNVSDFQVELLTKYGFSEYIVAFDGDASPASMSLCERLLLRGCRVSMVSLPMGEDPASVGSFESYLDQRRDIDLYALCVEKMGGFHAGG